MTLRRNCREEQMTDRLFHAVRPWKAITSLTVQIMAGSLRHVFATFPEMFGKMIFAIFQAYFFLIFNLTTCHLA